MDKNSFMQGYLLGCRLRGQRPEGKKPTAYSYNGTVLPPLPEWDKEAYPHAYMFCSVGEGDASVAANATLYLSTVPLYASTQKVGAVTMGYYGGAKADGDAIAFSYDIWNVDEDGNHIWAWLRYENGDKIGFTASKTLVSKTSKPHWANYDWLDYDDDSVWVAASEPIPLYGYEPPVN